MSTQSLVKRPTDCSILIVDDEKVICEVLKTALKPNYKVKVCNNGREAFSLIDQFEFDLVVTDLKLPDISGTEILPYAKSKDEFVEVIVITGYASLDTATKALNMGAVSYLTKPFAVSDFVFQVEKAIASRLFHLKSLKLMQQSDFLEPGVKKHIYDITALYYFSRKLMLSLEISEVMKVVLEEANQRTDAVFCTVGVNLKGFREIYVSPQNGELEDEKIKTKLLQFWNEVFPYLDKQEFVCDDIPVFVFKGRQSEHNASIDKKLRCVSVPMVLAGKTIGSIAVYRYENNDDTADCNQFMHVFTSLVAPVVEHGYVDILTRFQAKTDSLTGIGNHRFFHETLDREIARANRRKSDFSLVFLDIDNFKMINDTYGHQIGDAVIKDLTRRLVSNVRTADVVARYGGEEFCLVLPDGDEKGGEVLVERICRIISERPFTSASVSFTYTASFGLAVYRGSEPITKDELIAKADAAMYSSKRKGKNQVTVCS
ncbi:diguanylate cyclase with GAF sensor [Chitinispirillum alkaliphilum]|nr:diguanylate cyclase with GAF sensor [Chitinispirillum alkaliphilum]